MYSYYCKTLWVLLFNRERRYINVIIIVYTDFCVHACATVCVVCICVCERKSGCVCVCKNKWMYVHVHWFVLLSLSKFKNQITWSGSPHVIYPQALAEWTAYDFWKFINWSLTSAEKYWEYILFPLYSSERTCGGYDFPVQSSS